MIDSDVGPADCAIAFALPLDRNEFFGDLEAGDRDYAKSILRRNVGWDREHAWRLYRAGTVMSVRRFGLHARELGATVEERTSLSELAALAQSHAVLVLVAHARLVDPSPDDLDGAGLAARARSPRNEFDVQLAEIIGSEPESAAAASELLAEWIAAAHDWHRDSHRRESLAGAPATRAVFEVNYPEHVRSSPSLELRDGMYTAREIAEILPADTSTIVDLSVCHSTALAHPIKELRPRIRFLVNRSASSSRQRLIWVLGLLQMIHEQPQPYLEAFERLHSSVVGNANGRRNGVET